MKLKSLTRTRFRNWLANHHPRTIAGYCSNNEECVVARFLEKGLGHKGKAFVLLEEFVSNGKKYDTPTWVRNFIDKLDTEKESKSITYGEALRIFNELNGVHN